MSVDIACEYKNISYFNNALSRVKVLRRLYFIILTILTKKKLNAVRSCPCRKQGSVRRAGQPPLRGRDERLQEVPLQ